MSPVRAARRSPTSRPATACTTAPSEPATTTTRCETSGRTRAACRGASPCSSRCRWVGDRRPAVGQRSRLEARPAPRGDRRPARRASPAHAARARRERAEARPRGCSSGRPSRSRRSWRSAPRCACSRSRCWECRRGSRSSSITRGFRRARSRAAARPSGRPSSLWAWPSSISSARPLNSWLDQRDLRRMNATSRQADDMAARARGGQVDGDRAAGQPLPDACSSPPSWLDAAIPVRDLTLRLRALSAPSNGAQRHRARRRPGAALPRGVG